MVKIPSEPQRMRHWSRDYLAGVCWGCIPLPIGLSAVLLYDYGQASSLFLVSWLVVFTLLAYGVEFVVFCWSRKRSRAFLLGLVMLAIMMLLFMFNFSFRPLSLLYPL